MTEDFKYQPSYKLDRVKGQNQKIEDPDKAYQMAISQKHYENLARSYEQVLAGGDWPHDTQEQEAIKNLQENK